jgi:hypothetical protein
MSTPERKEEENEVNKNIESNEPMPSHIMYGDYAILMETNGEEMESWYYFIRVEGNEENLKHLQDQIEQVDWYILDEYSTFDLDLEHYVSAQTAKEMTKVDLNHTSFHRKFDGKLQKIDFGFGKKDKNKRKIKRVNDILCYGAIEEFIDDEDIDPEDLVSVSESDDTDNESFTSSSSSDSEESYEDRRKKYDVPPALRLRNSIKDKQDDRRKGGRR